MCPSRRLALSWVFNSSNSLKCANACLTNIITPKKDRTWPVRCCDNFFVFIVAFDRLFSVRLSNGKLLITGLKIGPAESKNMTVASVKIRRNPLRHRTDQVQKCFLLCWPCIFTQCVKYCNRLLKNEFTLCQSDYAAAFSYSMSVA